MHSWGGLVLVRNLWDDAGAGGTHYIKHEKRKKKKEEGTDFHQLSEIGGQPTARYIHLIPLWEMIATDIHTWTRAPAVGGRPAGVFSVNIFHNESKNVPTQKSKSCERAYFSFHFREQMGHMTKPNHRRTRVFLLLSDQHSRRHRRRGAPLFKVTLKKRGGPRFYYYLTVFCYAVGQCC